MNDASRTRRLLLRFLAAAALLAAAPPASAQKTDVLTLKNGDRITGEIKSYSQGKLTLDTSSVGWIYLKWNHILSISSDKQFDIETTDGVHHYGSLAASEPPGQLVIVSDTQTLSIDFFQVFLLAPVYQTFWRRWDGSLNFGFNYTQSSNLTQFNLDVDAVYRVKTYQLVLDVSSFFSKQDDVTASERGSLSLSYDRFLKNRWVLQTGVGLERNIQLGLKLRESAGLGIGRNVIQTNQAQLTPYVGLVGNREHPVEGEVTENIEGLVGCDYTYFMYDFPKLTVAASVQIYPSFTVDGRVRLQADASVKREIVSDFYLSLAVFDSYDSKDPSTQQSRNDWGPTISIGWQF